MNKNPFKGPELIFGSIFAFLGTIFFFLGIFAFTASNGEKIILLVSLGGLVFAATGAIFIGKYLEKNKRMKLLKASNRYIDAEILEIEPDWSIQINNRPVFRVIARYYGEDGTAYMYTSDVITKNPDPLLTKNFVRIYLDPEDSSLYYMDLESAITKTEVF